MQMREENVGDLEIVEAGFDQRAERAVAAVDQIRDAVDDERVARFAALRQVVRPALCAEQDQTVGVPRCAVVRPVLANLSEGRPDRRDGPGERGGQDPARRRDETTSRYD